MPPCWREIRRRRGRTAAQSLLGRSREAHEGLARYLAEHPAEWTVAARLGRDAAGRGQWRRAATLLGHAAALAGWVSDPQLLADLAEAQLHAGEPSTALTTARDAYRLQRASPRTTSVLAEALRATQEDGGGANVLLAKVRRMAGEPALALR